MSLTLMICRHIVRAFGETSFDHRVRHWVNWNVLSQSLLTQGRIWGESCKRKARSRADSHTDYRDIAVSISGFFSTMTAIMLGNVTEMWRFGAHDESTCVALLDIHVANSLERWFVKEDLEDRKMTSAYADACAEDLRLNFPQAMRSRPYLRWILLKSAELGCRSLRGLTDPYSALEKNCKNFPGLVVHRRGIPSSFYIPSISENPGWCFPEAPAQSNAPLHAVVMASEQLHDLATQALAYRLLAWRSAQPLAIFQKLASLQNDKQGDSQGRLETLLSSYLACEGRASREWLLAQLKETDDWTGHLQLRNPLLYFARDVTQRAIERSLHGINTSEDLRTTDFRYYPWLTDRLQRFITAGVARSADAAQSSSPVEGTGKRHRTPFPYDTQHGLREIQAHVANHQRGHSHHRAPSEAVIGGLRAVNFDKLSQNHKINSRQSTREWNPVNSVTRGRPNSTHPILEVAEGASRGTYSLG